MKISKRLTSYSSIFGENWVVGKFLIPLLSGEGSEIAGTLVDIGCGKSPFSPFFPNVQNYIKMDYHPTEHDVITADMNALPCKAQCADAVIIFQALADSPDPVGVLKEIQRILKPGGRLLVFESMDYPEHDPPNDYFRIMPEGLNLLAQQAGLNCKKCTRLGGIFTRFSTLWSTYLMGGLRQAWWGWFPGTIGILLGNLFLYSLDKLLPHPVLASNYLAILQKDNS